MDSTRQASVSNRQADAAGREGLHALGAAVRVAIRMLVGILCLLLTVSLLQCYVVVKQHQTGVIYRFGRPRRTLKPGQHGFVLPPPIEEFKAYAVTREKAVETRAFLPGGAVPGGGTAEGEVFSTLRPGIDGYLLTGDQNIVHCAATLFYRVSDAVPYYEHQIDGERMLKSLLHHAILRAAASMGAEEALFRVPAFTERVGGLLRQDVRKAGLGVEINRLILKSTPPLQAKAAFDAHIAASQRADELRKQAEGYRARLVNESEGSANQITALAGTEKIELTRRAQARATTFEQVFAQYQKNPDIVRRELYMQTLRRVADNVGESFILEQQEGREIRMLPGPNPDAARKGKTGDGTP